MKTAFDTALLLPEEMARADALAIQSGVPGTQLMTAAGQAVAHEIMHRWAPCSVVVACGPGNNGGDGYVVARVLAEQGWPVRVAAPEARGPKPATDAAHHAAQWKGPVEVLSERLLDPAPGLVVDGLYGAGLSRPLDDAAARFCEALMHHQVPVCAIDLPSGIEGAGGQIMGHIAVRATLTVTFFRKKPGHVLLPGRVHCGETVVANIGIPSDVLDAISPEVFENDPALWLRDYPWPRQEGHKYHRGYVLVSGGEIMTGAARLASRAAARIGAGLVTVAAPAPAWQVYASALESVMVAPYSNLDGFNQLLADARRNVLVVGPGAGPGGHTRDQTLAALATGRRVVLDADALTAFQDTPQALLSALSPECVLTPHEGEFARLFSTEGNKLARARRAAAQCNAVVLLKGADTVIASPDGRAVINTNAPPDLATGGAGDVLSGFIAGLLAQGMTPFKAACAAVWLQGDAATRHGPGLVAEDLIESVKPALSALKMIQAGKTGLS